MHILSIAATQTMVAIIIGDEQANKRYGDGSNYGKNSGLSIALRKVGTV